jgi:hypothetical protein
VCDGQDLVVCCVLDSRLVLWVLLRLGGVALMIVTSKPKWTFSCWVKGAPLMYASDGEFLPYKVEMTQAEEKIRIVVSGRKLHGSQSGRSLTFYMGQRDREPPEWVIAVIREAAFDKESV